MRSLIYAVVFFHLFPLLIFLVYPKSLRFNKINLLITGLIISSFLADLIGIWLGDSVVNTNLVSNSYIIIDRIINVLILIYFSSISLKLKKLLFATTIIVSIYQIASSFFNPYLLQHDYINIISGVILCLFSLHTLVALVYKNVAESSTINIRIWPVLAIFFFMSATLIPDMITNIDDSINFPKYFHQIRLGVTLGSNVLRDSLFALFFFETKKMNYDTGK
jgi:hypothetical protein